MAEEGAAVCMEANQVMEANNSLRMIVTQALLRQVTCPRRTNRQVCRNPMSKLMMRAALPRLARVRLMALEAHQDPRHANCQQPIMGRLMQATMLATCRPVPTRPATLDSNQASATIIFQRTITDTNTTNQTRHLSATRQTITIANQRPTTTIALSLVPPQHQCGPQIQLHLA